MLAESVRTALGEILLRALSFYPTSFRYFAEHFERDKKIEAYVNPRWPSLTRKAESLSPPQVTNCCKPSETGSLLLIPGKITILPEILSITEPQLGGLIVKLTQSGNFLARVHSYGYMANVSVLRAQCFLVILTTFTLVAGAGKSVLWCVISL